MSEGRASCAAHHKDPNKFSDPESAVILVPVATENFWAWPPAQLIGPGVRYNGHKLNMKSGEYGSPVEWHQDWAFYPHTNDDLLAVARCHRQEGGSPGATRRSLWWRSENLPC